MEEHNQDASPTKGHQYNLKWTNYTNNMLQVFSDHLLQELLVDVTLVCEGHLVKAHKIILSACSLYFREIFEVYTDKQPLIILNGVRFADLKQLIEFMYRGEVKVQDVDVVHLLQLAENLQVKGLCSVREKSGGLLPSSQVEKEQTAMKEKENVTTSKEQHIRTEGVTSIRRSSSKEHVNVDLQNTIKREPGVSMDYTSGDDSPLVIDEFADTLQGSLPIKTARSEPPIKRTKTTKDLSGTSRDLEEKNSNLSRPPNAFMLFTNEWRERLKKDHPNESNKEISVRLGNMWKNLPQSEKDQYYEAANKANTKFKTNYQKTQKVAVAKSKSIKYYEPIQLVKLVMPDDENVGSKDDDDVQILNVREISSSISNGDGNAKQ